MTLSTTLENLNNTISELLDEILQAKDKAGAYWDEDEW